MLLFVVFFFSSRRRHTRFDCDWSSDVCSSDLLAGGSTPKTLYRLLVDDPGLRAQVAWDKMHLFFSDERHVPPDNPESNFRMATEAMISRSPLKPEQVTRIKGEY